MSKVILIHYIPPTFFTSPLNGQKYLLPGWIPVSKETSLEDVNWINPYIKKKDSKKINLNEWNFESASTPGQFYTVRFVNEKLTCNCPGMWSSKDKKCKHIKKVAQEISSI